MPIVKKVVNRITEEEIEDSTCHSYQGFYIANFPSSIEYLERHFASWIDAVTSCLRSRIKAQDIDLLSHSVTILATHGWEWQESTDFGHPALEAIASKFEIALAKVSGFERDKLMEEWDNMVEYARQYLNLVENYKVIGGKYLTHLLQADGRMCWCWLNCYTAFLWQMELWKECFHN